MRMLDEISGIQVVFIAILEATARDLLTIISNKSGAIERVSWGKYSSKILGTLIGVECCQIYL
jgi:hypothetical protein